MTISDYKDKNQANVNNSDSFLTDVQLQELLQMIPKYAPPYYRSQQLTYVTDLPSLREFLDKEESALTETAYLKALIQSGPDALLLRAKELSPTAYEALLLQLLPYATSAGVQIIVSHHIHLANTYKLPVQISAAECAHMVELSNVSANIPNFGVSVHSMAEAETAIKSGAHWIVLGHLFLSRCKPGLTPRTQEECKDVLTLAHKHNVPVHGIGGINFTTYKMLDKNFEGIYVMTETMEQPNIDEYTTQWRHILP